MLTVLPLAALVLTSLAQPVAPAQPSSVVPPIAKQLPATWPPPGWPTRVTLPGEQPAKTDQTAKPAEKDEWVQVFKHVRVNRARKSVEFDGVVAWDFHNADTPRTELELLVCLPLRDKEHESLVLSKAKGADVHAALLMAGLEPGTPGRIEFGDGDGKDKQPGVKRVAPVGPEVDVRFAYLKEGKEVVDDPRSWVEDEAENREEARRIEAAKPTMMNGVTRRRDINYLTLAKNPYTYVFGGSKIGQMRNLEGEKVNVYAADELGTLIGLCTFGSETVGITRVYSPDSGVDAPNFVARNAAIPPADTPVRVRISPSTRAKIVSEEEEKAFPGLNDSLRGQ
ncbi:MAG: YdjY domain-containing protein [Phycisphaerales bacterium]